MNNGNTNHTGHSGICVSKYAESRDVCTVLLITRSRIGVRDDRKEGMLDSFIENCWKTLFFLVICIVLIPPVALAEPKADVQRAERYLQRLKTLKADFVQTAPNGHTATGIFYLKRPGRLRFEYTTPNNDFIVADGRFIYYWDSELAQQSHTLISHTLANFILREDISFDDDIMVSDVLTRDGDLHFTLKHREDEDAGHLTLIFNKKPFFLKEWMVQDMENRMTTVTLSNSVINKPLNKTLFYFIKPKKN